MKTVNIGTRGSGLALAQTGQVRDQLAAAWPGRELELAIIRTAGDQLALEPDRPLTLGKGLFTSELEQALLRGEIDIAIHSLKDLPTQFDAGLVLGAVPQRADYRDCLVTRGETVLKNFGKHPHIATGSRRRLSQLQRVREDVVGVEIRGNIDTRVRKFRERPEWSGIVLAMAGLDRLRPDLAGLTVVPLSPDEMLPAPGQGALALQIRANDADIAGLVGGIDDVATRQAVTAERAFLSGLGGGCEWPVGALGEISGDRMRLRGIYWHGMEKDPRIGEITGLAEDAELLGRELAVRLLA